MSGAVGIIGCGLLGSAVARTLALTGENVYAWNRTAESAAALATHGVTPCDSVAELTHHSELILAALTTYAATHEVLAAVDSLAGTTVAVLSTGVPADAERMATTVAQLEGRYLDTALLGYPTDLGAAATMLAVAGPVDVWKGHRPLFQLLGGASRHVSEDIAGANVLDVAATGAFYTVAYGAAVEAAAYAHARGLDPRALIPAAAAWLPILRRNLDEVAEAVASGEHHSDQATVDTYLEAARAWRAEMAGSGVRGRLIAATEQNLDAAHAQGLGQLGFSAQSVSIGGDTTRSPKR